MYWGGGAFNISGGEYSFKAHQDAIWLQQPHQVLGRSLALSCNLNLGLAPHVARLVEGSGLGYKAASGVYVLRSRATCQGFSLKASDVPVCPHLQFGKLTEPQLTNVSVPTTICKRPEAVPHSFLRTLGVGELKSPIGLKVRTEEQT